MYTSFTVTSILLSKSFSISSTHSYAYSSLELQTRQLADLAFLLQNYDLAFQTYHSVKKDFQGSSMWLHYAGAVVSGSCSQPVLTLCSRA